MGRNHIDDDMFANSFVLLNLSLTPLRSTSGAEKEGDLPKEYSEELVKVELFTERSDLYNWGNYGMEWL